MSSPFFDLFRNQNEQNLIKELVDESLLIHSDDMYYVIREDSALKDDVLNADPAPFYQKWYEVPFYVKNVYEFEGDGAFLQKFGNIEIRDQIRLVLSRSHFDNEVVANETTITRPREGDLVYLPMHGKLFTILHVHQYSVFYQLGALTSWEIQCELFEYSNEVFNTGIENIDVYSKSSLNQYDYGITDHNGKLIFDHNGTLITDHTKNYSVDETSLVSDLDSFEIEETDIIDWTQKDPFSERT